MNSIIDHFVHVLPAAVRKGALGRSVDPPGNSHIKKTGHSSRLLGVKNAVLLPPRVLSLQRPTAGGVWKTRIANSE